MTSVVLVRTCFVSACANTLFNTRDSNPLDFHKAAVVARRTTRSSTVPCTHRSHRRSLAAPRPGRRRRAPWSTYHPASLRKPSHSFTAVRSLSAEQSKQSRCPTREQEAMDEMVLLQRSIDETVRNGASTPEQRHHVGRDGSHDETRPRRFPDDSLASPQAHMDDFVETRSSRSASTTSRSTNRLSLTLPILPPNAYPARAGPASSTTAAFPPTPLDTPHLASPADPNDFITAIAAQERRVLELREELSRAESDLARLKKQWATHEAYKKRGTRRNTELIPGLGSPDSQDETAIRRSIELDRRKALLSQQNQHGTPERSRRRVFTGSHTRTLSLLSPTKTDGPFSANNDETESAKSESIGGFTPISPAHLAKRASWAARSTQTAGVKQLAEDLRTGLWTFMEDLRQATVGDEPITGNGAYMRGRDGSMRAASAGGDHDTIRAPGSARPRVASAFDETPKASSKPAKEDGEDDGVPRPGLRRSKTDAGARTTKRFSWTPLTMDSYDDNDWSNWDSPSSSSPRWSGTTVNGDIIPSIPQKRTDDSDTASLKKKPSKPRLARSPSPSKTSTAETTSFASPLSPHKLEELLPQALNKLAPSNIKRTAADFMKEWERSLSTPTEGNANANANVTTV